jgi:hypothetical protein
MWPRPNPAWPLAFHSSRRPSRTMSARGRITARSSEWNRPARLAPGAPVDSRPANLTVKLVGHPDRAHSRFPAAIPPQVVLCARRRLPFRNSSWSSGRARHALVLRPLPPALAALFSRACTSARNHQNACEFLLFDELLQGWIAQPAPELKVTAAQLAPWHLPHIGHRQTPFANDFL